MSINLFLSKSKYTIFRYLAVISVILISTEVIYFKKSFTPLHEVPRFIFYLISISLQIVILYFIQILIKTFLVDNLKFNKNKKAIDITNENVFDSINVVDDVDEVTQIDDRDHKLRFDVAINYTTKVFENNITPQDLELLKKLIEKHSKKEDIVSFNPIATNVFSIQDLRAFGWTIWYHFKSINDEKQEVFVEKFCKWFKALENRVCSTQVSHFANDNLKGKIQKDKNLYEKYLPGKYKK